MSVWRQVVLFVCAQTNGTLCLYADRWYFVSQCFVCVCVCVQTSGTLCVCRPVTVCRSEREQQQNRELCLWLKHCWQKWTLHMMTFVPGPLSTFTMVHISCTLTLCLQSFHWLLFRARIDDKLWSICRHLFSASSPACLSDLFTVYTLSSSLVLLQTHVLCIRLVVYRLILLVLW